MNERIKELVDQTVARFEQDMDGSMEPANWGDYWISYDELEAFAELIIKECVGICMIEYDTGLEPAPQAPQIARQIKQHFGVE
jgi:hypothetical protein